ncbi:MAG: hypothetical protein AAGH15_16345 [Myxococcota bacterium]
MYTPQRQIYVPAPQAPASPNTPASPGTRRRRPSPLGEPGQPVGFAFRRVAWEGPGTAQVLPLPRRRRPLGELSTMTTRQAFGGVAWTGEKPLPPTSEQTLRSTKAVLESFNWE